MSLRSVGVRRWAQPWRITAAVCLVAAATVGALYPIYVVAEFSATAGSFVQIYYDDGGGFGESKSVRVPFEPGLRTYTFLLPLKQPLALRFDPVNAPGKLELARIGYTSAFFSRSWQGSALAGFAVPANQLRIAGVNESGLHAESLGEDPVFMLSEIPMFIWWRCTQSVLFAAFSACLLMAVAYRGFWINRVRLLLGRAEVIFGEGLRRIETPHIVLAMGGLFVVLTSSHLHGYSTPVWHEFIDGSPAPEVLAGRPQAIRSDDWMVQIPFALSQTRGASPFAPSGSLVGPEGADLRIVDTVPLNHWLGALRPETWGYFWGGEFGVAWQWWFEALGSVVSVFLLLSLLFPPERRALAFATALVIPLSPYLNLWSFRPATLLIHICLCLFFTVQFLRCRRSWSSVAALIAALWSGLCFGLTIYPPHQVTLAFLYVLLLPGFALVALAGRRPSRKEWVLKGCAGVFALAIAGLAVWQFFVEAAPAVRLMSQTVYPGQRRLASGGFAAWNFLATWGLPHWMLAEKEWERIGGNICESARFIVTFPVTLPLLAGQEWQQHRARIWRWSPLVIGLGVFVALALVWASVGFPSAAASLTGWDRVPGKRTQLALGLADAIALALIASRSERRPHWKSLMWATLAACLVAVLARETLGGLVPSGHTFVAPLAFIFAAVLVASYLLNWSPSHAVIVLVVLNLAGSVGFNPLVKGGIDYLENNALLATVKPLASQFRQANGRDSVWAVFDNIAIANLLRSSGLHVANGTHYVPQFTLWKALDPLGTHLNDYNRYATVAFAADLGGHEVQIASPQPDLVLVRMDPAADELRNAGVDFVLAASGDPTFPERMKDRAQLVASVGHFYVLRLGSSLGK